MPAQETEVKLSKKTTIKLKPVNMFEQMTADVYGAALAEKMGVKITMALSIKCWALCSIRAVNGVPASPLANYNEFVGLAQDIEGAESFELTDAYLLASGLGAPQQPGKAEATPADS